MKLTSGSRLGPYEIVAPIGAGGMGEVYRARDTRLDRTVAIKILPAEFADDTKFRIRFEREAKSISALNHPHICALYDVGPDYLVMEHCEGETLAERIAAGALPLQRVLQYGIEMADALEKAHRHGIIHRDLKPSNVMLTKSGVKLLDFGLAKQRVESSPVDATAQQLTEEGKIVGTIQYMAPELLAGKEADARSDIFALGLVLYEMTTGKPAFTGASKASLIAAILEHEPEPLKPTSPQALDRVIRACLAKDPDERIQSAHDVKLQLKWIGESADVTAGLRRPRAVIFASMAAIALVATVASFIIGRSQRALSRQPLRHYAIPLPANAPLEKGSPETVIAVSPDGSRLAYVTETEPHQLVLRSSDRGGAKAISGTEGARNPFFSPDGEWVGFEADPFLKKVSLAGGGPVTICAAHNTRGAAWGSDNQIVFAQNWSSLQRVSASGGKPQPVTRYSIDRSEFWPIILPGGKHVLYTLGDWSGNLDNSKIVAVSLEDGRSRVVLEGATNAQYIPGGHLLYLRSGTLFSISFDPVTLKVSGSPTPIVEDVAGWGVADAAVSSDGTLFYVPRNVADLQSQLVWVDRKGVATPITPKRSGFSEPQLSPDGKHLLVCIEDTKNRSDVWLCDLGSDAWTRLTSGGVHFAPRWSPDGKQITFSSNRNGTPNIFLMPSDASAPAKQLTRNQSAWTWATSWSPDGRTLLATWQRGVTGFDIMTVPISQPDHATPFIATAANEEEGAFSPDGRWIAFQSRESDNFEIYIEAYPQGGRKWLISSQGGVSALWRRDGKELFYRSGNKVMAVQIQLGPELVIGKPRMLFDGDFDSDYDVTADGQRFVMVRSEKPTPATQINVVLGAFETPRH